MNIKNIGVVGFGVMGSGIAQVCAQSGYNVIAMDVNDQLVEKGLGSIRSFLTKSVEKGKLTSEEKEAALKRIKGAIHLEDLKECSLVIEAVKEDLDLKKTVFAQLDKICPKEAILASNTSVLSVLDMAMATGRPAQVLGMHFFNPVPLMKTVELVKTIVTVDSTMAIATAFTESIKKIAVYAKDTPGFIVDRLSIAFSLNAVRMLEAGVGTVEDIDKGVSLSLNHPMGPFQLMDLIGIDVLYFVATSLHQQLGDPQYQLPITVQKMVTAGWLGKKTGKGFYDYSKSS